MAILRCNCIHQFQDIEHGKGMRVHNIAPKTNGGAGGWRCTVCSNVKALGVVKPEEKR